MAPEQRRAADGDVATTFLLAEHERLRALFLSTCESADRRVTLFLTLTTTIVGVSVALSQLGLQTLQLLELALASALGIFLLGVTTFNRLLERSMQSTEYLRAINRIHHYFIERAPEIEPYLFWAPYDDTPHYDTRGVGGAETREVILLINCISCAASAGLVLLVLNVNGIGWAIVAAAVAFVISFVGHSAYERWTLWREEKHKVALVRYPMPREERVSPSGGDATARQQLTTNE